MSYINYFNLSQHAILNCSTDALIIKGIFFLCVKFIHILFESHCPKLPYIIQSHKAVPQKSPFQTAQKAAACVG